MLLGSGVVQVGTRSPALLAQTALTLQEMSQGRFLLGLGSSGPQVLEGLHGVPFAHPLGRMRETVEVVRRVMAGEKVTHDGRHVRLPLPGGEARADAGVGDVGPPRPDLPRDALAQDAAAHRRGRRRLAGHQLRPRGGVDVDFEPLAEGAAASGRTLADLDLCQGAEVAFTDDPGRIDAMLDERRAGLAFSLGGMGSASRNFYRDAYARQGYGEVAAEVHALWQAGRRDDAAQAVTAVDGRGDDADRDAGRGARAAGRVARRRDQHGPALPGGRDARRAAGHAGAGDRAGEGGRMTEPAGTTLPWRERDSGTCSIARTMAVLGEPWTVLVVRDLLHGVRRFDELVAHLGIARTVLARRLAVLVDAGLVETSEYREPGRRSRREYRLTRAGHDLRPVLLALMTWGDAHLDGGAGPPVVVRHEGCGAPVHLVEECAAGHRLAAADRVRSTPGPGARPAPVGTDP